MSPLLFRDINVPLPSIPVLGEVMNSRIFLMFSPNFIFQIYCNNIDFAGSHSHLQLHTGKYKVP